MLKSPKPKSSRTARRKAEFDAAHEQGMDALKRKDYAAAGKAIKREKQIIAAGAGKTTAKSTKGPK